MIRPLRVAHCRVTIVLSLALALLFIAALLIQKPAPVNPQLLNSLTQRGGTER
jgi:hypothetical protein